MFECKDLLGHFVEKTTCNPKVYPKELPLIKNIETAFRLGGKGTAAKPSNFPIKTVDYILSKYNVNNNWYDFSCGWGARLTGALKNKVNYYGTDPNYILTQRLSNLIALWKDTIGNNSYTEIRTQGSEVFVNEWKNKFGLAFSSPPYFYLEDYKIGKQSWDKGTSYEQWLSEYMYNTINNISKYLVAGGYLAININNFLHYNLVDDTKRIIEENGFTYITTETLTNIKRTNSNGGLNDNSEGIMIFQLR